MGNHNHHIPEKPPEKLVLPQSFYIGSIACMVIGAVAFLAGLFVLGDPVRAWKAYLIGLTFVTMLSIAGPFFMATQYLTRSGWSPLVRRIPESFAPAIVPCAVLALILVFGGSTTIFEWTDPAMATDPIVSKKLGYLNVPFMAVRTIIGLGLMTGLGLWMVRNSQKQDEDGDRKHNHLNATLSSVYLIVMSLGLTMFSVDFLMSMQPHWFSTMWAANIWATMFQAGMALATGITIVLVQKGQLRGYVNGNHIHDMSKLTFAATPFWAYIVFCQFLLIWYANLPEEATFYNTRLAHGWAGFTFFLFIGKFALPFLLMLPRGTKRNENGLMLPICVWIVLLSIVEVWWWVVPAPSPGVHHTAPQLPWLEVLVVLGFVGMFAFVTGKTLTRYNLIPIKDPRLLEAFHHHQ